MIDFSGKKRRALNQVFEIQRDKGCILKCLFIDPVTDLKNGNFYYIIYCVDKNLYDKFF